MFWNAEAEAEQEAVIQLIERMPPKKRSVRAAYDDEEDGEEQEYRKELDDFDQFVKLLRRGPKPLGNGGYSFLGFSVSKPPLSIFDQNAWVIASKNKTVLERLSSFLALVHKYDGELEAKENMVAKRIVQWLDLTKQKLAMFSEERRLLGEVTGCVHVGEPTSLVQSDVWDRIESKVNVEKNECSRAMDEFSLWIDELVVAITVMRNKEEATMLRSAPFPSPKRLVTPEAASPPPVDTVAPLISRPPPVQPPSSLGLLQAYDEEDDLSGEQVVPAYDESDIQELHTEEILPAYGEDDDYSEGVLSDDYSE